MQATLPCADQFLAHHLAYNFLGKVFYEQPTAEFLNLLASEGMFDDWLLDGEHPDIQAGLALLRSFAAQWDEAQLPALNHDYMRLFIGPDKLLAPPWESVYTSPEGLIFDKSTLEVRHEYQRFGMPISKLHNEPEDHLGLELRFISHLTALGLDALGQNQVEATALIVGALDTFLHDHLLCWADQCLDKIIAHANTAYYRGIALLTRGCLAQTKIAFTTVAAG
jgi:TorA maturation chaperone TorD